MENTTTTTDARPSSSPILLIIFWLYVGVPLALGIWETLLKAAALFK
jgi:hypothetical protein